MQATRMFLPENMLAKNLEVYYVKTSKSLACMAERIHTDLDLRRLDYGLTQLSS
jgi:hypothetical protein